MSRTERGRAGAKINYTLDILDRRPDGYHEIASIMQTIALNDWIEVTRGLFPGGGDGVPPRSSAGLKKAGISVSVSGPQSNGVSADENNLVYKAATAVLRHAGIDPVGESVSINLTKHIPSQAGLGGGSSDAATTILLMNKIYDLNIAYDDLCAIAAKIGCDVPFFLTGGTARVEGLGEKVMVIDRTGTGRLYQDWIVIVKPAIGVSTAAAYAALDSTRSLRSSTSEGHLAAGAIPEGSTTPSALPANAQPAGSATAAWEASFLANRSCECSNDFQQEILRLSPELAAVHSQFTDIARANGGTPPLLCGSGSAFFSSTNGEHSARNMARDLTQQLNAAVFVTQPCTGGID